MRDQTVYVTRFRWTPLILGAVVGQIVSIMAIWLPRANERIAKLEERIVVLEQNQKVEK